MKIINYSRYYIMEVLYVERDYVVDKEIIVITYLLLLKVQQNYQGHRFEILLIMFSLLKLLYLYY